MSGTHLPQPVHCDAPRTSPLIGAVRTLALRAMRRETDRGWQESSVRSSWSSASGKWGLRFQHSRYGQISLWAVETLQFEVEFANSSLI